MECKYRQNFLLYVLQKRINRYIMECKSTKPILTIMSCCGINRYIMECKYHILTRQQEKVIELIDTLWNVNSRIKERYI